MHLPLQSVVATCRWWVAAGYEEGAAGGETQSERLGMDEKFVHMIEAHGLGFTLNDLSSATTIEIDVVPMNDGGTGAASPTVSKVVGV